MVKGEEDLDFDLDLDLDFDLDLDLDLDLILKSNNLIDINSAKGSLIANTVNFINDSRLKSETKRFIEDLVDQKILGSNFEKFLISLIRIISKRTFQSSKKANIFVMEKVESKF